MVTRTARRDPMKSKSGTFTLRAAVLVAAAIVLGWATHNDVRADERVVRIVALGDSLMGRSRLPADAYPFPDKLEFALGAKGQSVAVANAGVGGDSAANGLARLDRSVPDGTDAVILELGWWDMTRGVDPNVTRASLARILSDLKARRIVVLLCGVRPHTKFGDEHEKAWWMACTQTQRVSRRSSNASYHTSKL